MKACFITTESNETHKHPESFACIEGNEVRHVVFSNKRTQHALEGAALDYHVFSSTVRYRPDLIVYVGGCQGLMPSTEVLNKMNREVAPAVLLVSDAAHLGSKWPALIQKYDDAESFSLTVALDGVKKWEKNERHMTLLTPIDPKRFPDPPVPHLERTILFGFAGNKSRHRFEKVDAMEKFGLRVRGRTGETHETDADLKTISDSYQGCCDFMAATRIAPNFAQSGYLEEMHVKGRVIEAGLAGCMLMEPKGSPTQDWFVPGADYLEYASMDEAREIVSYYGSRPQFTQEMGLSLRKKVLSEHRPERFWANVMRRLKK